MARTHTTKALITGIAGFIGSHLADECLAQGYQVVGVDNLSNGLPQNVPAKAKFVCLDVLSGDFRRLVESEKPDLIFHEAAQPSLRYSIECPDEDAEINIVGTIKVIEAARSVGAHLVFASTSAVYAPDAPVPFYEHDARHPNLPYGVAKYAAEMYIQNGSISYTILRYGNVYGPRQRPLGENQLIPHCIRYLKGLEPQFCINGDGEQRRDFVYVRDVARANVMVHSRGTYNVSTGKGTSVNEVCRLLAVVAGKSGLAFPHGPAKVGEARDSILATQLIRHSGWEAKTTLEQGLTETWNTYAA